MQPAASQQPNFKSTNNSRSSLIVILALLLFALSGLLTGFATGAFIHSRPTDQQNANNGNNTNKSGSTTKVTVTPSQTSVAHSTQTPSVLTLGLGCPSIQYTFAETRSTTFQLQAQSTAKSPTCTNSGGGKPLNIAGITCRLWLTKNSNFKDNIPVDRTKSISTLQQPFPKEDADGITFDPSTPQIQLSNAQGQVTWKYQLSSSLDKGTYYLIVLNDYQGTLYNWNARQISVT